MRIGSKGTSVPVCIIPKDSGITKNSLMSSLPATCTGKVSLIFVAP